MSKVVERKPDRAMKSFRNPKLLLLLTAVVVTGLLAFRFWPQQPLPSGVTADRIVVEKAARRLTLYRGDAPLKSYRVSLGDAPQGAKEREGDERTPEGIYRIDGRNPQSAFHLALRISYPDTGDHARARAKGFAPGGDIMIHGMKNGLGWLGRLHLIWDWTDGCIAVTEGEIREIWRAVPLGTIVEIHP